MAASPTRQAMCMAVPPGGGGGDFVECVCMGGLLVHAHTHPHSHTHMYRRTDGRHDSLTYSPPTARAPTSAPCCKSSWTICWLLIGWLLVGSCVCVVCVCVCFDGNPPSDGSRRGSTVAHPHTDTHTHNTNTHTETERDTHTHKTNTPTEQTDRHTVSHPPRHGPCKSPHTETHPHIPNTSTVPHSSTCVLVLPKDSVPQQHM